VKAMPALAMRRWDPKLVGPLRQTAPRSQNPASPWVCSRARSVGRGAGHERAAERTGGAAPCGSLPGDWPTIGLRWIPPLAVADELATAVREEVWGLGPLDPVPEFGPLLTAGGFDLREADLAVDRGGNEALMFPGADGRLHIRVDTRPAQPWGTSCEELRDETRRHRLRFRVAHELAHSFFYERSPTGPRRGRRSTPAEERFCDAFASALLLPAEAVSAAPPSADSVLRLHERFGVSVETAARRLAELQPSVDVTVGFWPEHEHQVPATVRVQWATGGPTDGGALQAILSSNLSPGRDLTLTRSPPPRRQVVVVARRED
jgi:hypothetical protein